MLRRPGEHRVYRVSVLRRPGEHRVSAYCVAQTSIASLCACCAAQASSPPSNMLGEDKVDDQEHNSAMGRESLCGAS